MKSFFDSLNEAIRGGEQSMVNFFSAIGPWLAPLAPAYSSWHHMTSVMGYPAWVAWAIACVVEVLGLSAVSTVISFWAYNRRKMAEYKKAPVWIAMLSFVSYLSIILTVNVLLDLSNIASTGWNPEYVKVLANGMLCLLSVPAAVILAVRTQHRELLDGLERAKAERALEKAKTRRPVETRTAESRGAFRRQKSLFLQEYRDGTVYDRLNGQPMTAENLSEAYGTSPRSAFRWLSEIRGNGK